MILKVLTVKQIVRSILLFTFLLILTLSADGKADISVKTNLAIIQGLLEKITRTILERSNLSASDSIVLNFNAEEKSLIAGNSISSFLKAMGYHVFFNDSISSMKCVKFDIIKVGINVKYDKIFRDTFMGSRKVQREISVIISGDVLDTKKMNQLLFSGTISQHLSDTVAVDSIDDIEFPVSEVTHSELPSENYFDKLIEPVIIIGATGVAVYLFFHIRS